MHTHVLLGADVLVRFPVPAQCEEANRIERLNIELKKKLKEGDGEQTIQEIKNYFEIPFLCG